MPLLIRSFYVKTFANSHLKETSVKADSAANQTVKRKQCVQTNPKSKLQIRSFGNGDNGPLKKKIFFPYWQKIIKYKWGPSTQQVSLSKYFFGNPKTQCYRHN